MNWAQPEWLNLLWAVPLIGAAFVLAHRSRRRALAALGPLMSRRVSARASRVHAARALMWTAAFACFTFALAQPRWGFRWQELRQEGLSLVVVLDVSRSMDAEDVSPSRMERARREIRDLAGMLAGDRVGLVLAAGGAYAQMPLTLDYEVLDALARRADTSILRGQGSDLGAAIDKARELLAADDQSGDRAILLISDGEDHGERGVEAASQAAEAGIYVYTVGIGTPDGAPIPLAEGGFKNDRSGKVVLTRLGEDALQQIAAAGQGAYVRSVAGDADMQAIYLDQIRGQLQAAEQGVRRDKIWTERYSLFLGLGLLLIVGSYLLRPGALRLSGLAVALLAVSVTARAEELDALLQQQASSPDDMALAEQVGAALYNAGRYAEAARVLEQVAARGSDGQRERARYNAGLARYSAGQLTAALEDWQKVLQGNPEHAHAQQNAAAVQAEIQARMQQPPPEQQNSDQQQQDQQPQDQQPQQDQQAGDQQQNPQDQQPQESQAHDGTFEEPQQPQEPQQGGDTGQQEATAQAQAEAEPSEPQEQGEPQAGEPIEEGDMSEEAARRLLDSVEEGEPRVRVGEQSRGGNDW